ncbi:hypothetical protein [Planktothrix agardhii]|jgi:hypothetical protein|uniref:Uncharacterized protein n=1 Tax=Planktothrix agardhii TaxID=1160 RepID=A0AAD1Q5R9_PLAAG|nr:hypothetical protein [Planktothrix agardhii]MBG0746630.1 hypothetical protein [Planktothrix agardhii KL2]CAD5960903.1 hypothetical protein PANO66_03278 [Planktothrix agardhii]CAD5961388.1 hypothetical protein PANO66_03309 [Planktothrix agardhii]
MQINELKAVSEQLQAKGLNIPLALLESAQTLLIQQEISLNPSVNDVVRLALLRTQNPQLSDPQIVELFLAAKQDSLSTKGGYGDAIALNIESEIWAALEKSEIFETIAQNIQAKAIDSVLNSLSTGFNGERFKGRLNALSQSNRRFNIQSQKQDENIINCDYESLDNVIDQCLAPHEPKLLNSSETFRHSNNGGNSPKKLQGTGKGN